MFYYPPVTLRDPLVTRDNVTVVQNADVPCIKCPTCGLLCKNDKSYREHFRAECKKDKDNQHATCSVGKDDIPDGIPVRDYITSGYVILIVFDCITDMR